MKSFIFLALWGSSVGLLAQEACYVGATVTDPKQVAGDFTGSINCRDSQTNIPLRNLDYRNGKLVQRYVYEGMQLKSITEWYDNGNLKSEVPYSVKGIDGVKKEYYENGKLQTEITFANGSLKSRKDYPREEAPAKVAKKEPAPVREAPKVAVKESKDGKLQKFNHPNGKLEREVIYQADHQVYGKFYREDGSLESVNLNDREGRENSYLRYNAQGKLERIQCGSEAAKYPEMKSICGYSGRQETATYDSDGKKEREYTYLNGKLRLVKDYSNGQLSRETPFDGERTDASGIDGVEKMYGTNGKLSNETTYVKGKRQGVTKSFYQSGKIEQIQQYENDNSVARIEYNKEGNPSVIKCGKYALTKEFMKWCGYEGKYDLTLYTDENKKWHTVTYVDGKQSHVVEFSAKGKVAETRSIASEGKLGTIVENYESGAKHLERSVDKGGETVGWAKEWAESGQLIKESLYAKGMITSEKEYFMNGQLKKSLERVKQGDSKIVKYTDYYDNGQAEEEGTVIEGTKSYHSAWYFWRYETLKQDGPVKNFRRDGTLAYITNYKDGTREGIRQEFFPDGKTIEEETVYKDGQRVSQKEYDRQGRMIASDEYFADGSKKSLMKK